MTHYGPYTPDPPAPVYTEPWAAPEGPAERDQRRQRQRDGPCAGHQGCDCPKCSNARWAERCERDDCHAGFLDDVVSYGAVVSVPCPKCWRHRPRWTVEVWTRLDMEVEGE